MSKRGRPSKENRTVTFSLPEATIDAISQLSERWGISKSEVVAQAVNAVDGDLVEQLNKAQERWEAVRKLLK